MILAGEMGYGGRPATDLWSPPPPPRGDDYLYEMPDGRKVPWIPTTNPWRTNGGPLIERAPSNDVGGWLAQHRDLNRNAPMINEAGQAMHYGRKPGQPPGQVIGNNLMQAVGSMRDGSPLSAQKTGSQGWSLGSAIGGAFGAGGRFSGAAPTIAQHIPNLFGQQEPTGFASAYRAR